MPALNPVPNVIKFSFQHTIAGTNAFVHWYWKYGGTAPASSDMAAICNSVKSAWSTNFTTMASTQTVFQLVQGTDLTSASGSQNQSSGTVTGTRTGTPLTANDCAMINQHITRRYRGGKPRQYWPFGTTTDLNGPQLWSTTFTGALGTAYAAVNTAIAAITWTGGNMVNAVNVSYFHGFTVVTNPSTGRAKNVPTPRATPLVDNVASTSVNGRVATQRRRQHFSA